MIRGRTAAPLALTLTLLAGTASAQQGEPKLSDVMPPPAAATDQPSSVNRDERAVEVLTAAREALVEAKTVLFTVQSEINAKSGPLAAFKLGADGNVWARQEDNGTWTRTMIGQADDIGTSEQISFTVIKSGQNASWIDHENQEVIHAIGRYAKGRVYGSADLLGVDYLFAAKPFAAELGAPTLEYVGTETLDGTVCDVVRADYGERTLAKRWYLASSDGFLLAVLVGTVVSAPVMMAYWFAPMLAAWHGIAAPRAMIYSLLACLMNWKAFFVYSLGLFLVAGVLPGMVVAILGMISPTLAALASVPLPLIMVPVVFASFYPNVRDIFGEPGEQSPRPAAVEADD